MKVTKLVVWPFGVLGLHALLTVSGGYYWWAHVDKIMHILGGMSIALSGIGAINFFSNRGDIKIRNSFITAVITLSFVAFAAVGWEFLEFTLDLIVHTHMQPSLIDTMGDLLAGLCGGGVIILLKNTLEDSK
jgi:hypothetical protein